MDAVISRQSQPYQQLRSKRIKSALLGVLAVAVLTVRPAQAKDIHFGDMVLTNPRVYCASNASNSTIGLL